MEHLKAGIAIPQICVYLAHDLDDHLARLRGYLQPIIIAVRARTPAGDKGVHIIVPVYPVVLIDGVVVIDYVVEQALPAIHGGLDVLDIDVHRQGVLELTFEAPEGWVPSGSNVHFLVHLAVHEHRLHIVKARCGRRRGCCHIEDIELPKCYADHHDDHYRIAIRHKVLHGAL